MNNMKKLASLLLALVMVLAMAAPAMAEETTGYKITINTEMEGHEFTAYQIFAGDLSTDENGKLVLSNIVWGDGITAAGQEALLMFKKNEGEDAYASAAAQADALSEGNAADFAALAEKHVTGGEKSTATENGYQITVLDAGYYLVKTTDVPDTDGAYTKFILAVVGNAVANLKADVPEVEKKVKDTNDSTGDTTDWQDSADYDIGDAVPFQLKATLADNVSAYDTYKIVFHDTLSAGLTYNNDAKVTYNGTDVTSYFTIASENGTLTISCDNVKAFKAGDKEAITVEYTAILNENAVIGAAGNPNTVKLEYSNNPNWVNEGNDGVDNDGDGETDEPDEGEDDDEGDEPTGETPEDKVIVFTFKTIVNKVNENKDPLVGASFTLYKKLSALPTEGIAGTDYIVETENDVTTYWEVKGTVDGTDLSTFEWKGLDDGEYKLVESGTPAGYNTMEDLYFTINATHDATADDPKLLTLTGGDKFTGDVNAGTLTGTIENVPGATLPETGGMGTTVLYVIGGLLVAGAAIVLFAKKRAAK